MSSPTVTAETVMLTCVIDAQEDRDIAVVDIPNAFVQTVVDEEDAQHRVMSVLEDHWWISWYQLYQMSMVCICPRIRVARRY